MLIDVSTLTSNTVDAVYQSILYWTDYFALDLALVQHNYGNFCSRIGDFATACAIKLQAWPAQGWCGRDQAGRNLNSGRMDPCGRACADTRRNP